MIICRRYPARPKGVVEMGMTDKQFNGYLRLILDDLEEIQEEESQEKRTEKLRKLIEHIRDTIED